MPKCCLHVGYAFQQTGLGNDRQIGAISSLMPAKVAQGHVGWLSTLANSSLDLQLLGGDQSGMKSPGLRIPPRKNDNNLGDSIHQQWHVFHCLADLVNNPEFGKAQPDGAGLTLIAGGSEAYAEVQ